jgi:hypothetical protein
MRDGSCPRPPQPQRLHLGPLSPTPLPHGSVAASPSTTWMSHLRRWPTPSHMSMTSSSCCRLGRAAADSSSRYQPGRSAPASSSHRWPGMTSMTCSTSPCLSTHCATTRSSSTPSATSGTAMCCWLLPHITGEGGARLFPCTTG